MFVPLRRFTLPDDVCLQAPPEDTSKQFVVSDKPVFGSVEEEHMYNRFYWCTHKLQELVTCEWRLASWA